MIRNALSTAFAFASVGPFLPPSSYAHHARIRSDIPVRELACSRQDLTYHRQLYSDAVRCTQLLRSLAANDWTAESAGTVFAAPLVADVERVVRVLSQLSSELRFNLTALQ